MSRSSSASLVKIWEYEGQPSAATSRTCTEVKINSNNSSAVAAELLKYYQKHGMENIAKEVGIIHSNNDANNTSINQVQVTPRKAVIALPIHTRSPSVNMSPFKMEQAILPKTVHIPNSPVILGSTPQRVMANVISSPRTPQQLLTSSDSLSWSGKRPHLIEGDYSESKRCKKGEKGGKGLRHFSMKVCEKVRKKGTTSYNEVADELVAEFTDPHRNICPTEQAYDQKNIRRRVYDALNVLMAMNIISKEKKEIKWLGLPTNSAQEYQNLEREKQKRLERIRMKTQRVQELILQQIAFKNLVEKNKLTEKMEGTTPSCKIHLPFVVINTDKDTVVECSISADKTEFVFNFNDSFKISDDVEIMKRMGMVLHLDTGTCTEEELEKAKSLVPKALQAYVVQMAHGVTDFPPGMSSEGNSIKLEGDLYNEPTSDFQEASSSSMLGSDFIGVEVALESSQTGLSRQSSVCSLSDMRSRQEASTPSDFSESEPESSGDDDI